jgi:hypothetical protein
VSRKSSPGRHQMREMAEDLAAEAPSSCPVQPRSSQSTWRKTTNGGRSRSLWARWSAMSSLGRRAEIPPPHAGLCKTRGDSARTINNARKMARGDDESTWPNSPGWELFSPQNSGARGKAKAARICRAAQSAPLCRAGWWCGRIYVPRPRVKEILNRKF